MMVESDEPDPPLPLPLLLLADSGSAKNRCLWRNTSTPPKVADSGRTAEGGGAFIDRGYTDPYVATDWMDFPSSTMDDVLNLAVEKLRL
jgi:hypothetical protein